MSIDRKDLDRLLRQIGSPPPPAALWDVTRSRAEEVLNQFASPDRWRRIWESRPLRLAWSAAVVALLAAQVALPTKTTRKRPAAEAAGPALQAAGSRELLEVVALPRLRESYSTFESTVSPRSPVAAPSPADSGRIKEKTS